MSEEEIKKQYANGIVNTDEVIESLIDKFKIDKALVDIQQLQLIAEYLIYRVDKLQKENENAKWYIYQMIARINEDIADYIDDGKEANKDIIGELRETKKQWQDVEKLLNGESKDNLYNDWRKYGEYE